MIPISNVVADMERGGMLLDSTPEVIAYEVGDMIKANFYRRVRGTKLSDGYREEMRCAAADALMQIRVLLHLNGIDFDETVDLGESRVYDRLAEFNKRKTLPRPDEQEVDVDLGHKAETLSDPGHHHSHSMSFGSTSGRPNWNGYRRTGD